MFELDHIIDSSLITNRPFRPHLATKIFVNILRHFFSNPNLLTTERFRKKYNPDVSLSREDNVAILSASSWQPEITDKTPSIMVYRLQWNAKRIGMGDGLIQASKTQESEEYSWMWEGAHAFICLSSESKEAEDMAEELINIFMNFLPVIRRVIGLNRMQLASIGRLTQFVSTKDFFQIPIIVKYEWIESWEISPSPDQVDLQREIILKTKEELNL